MVGLLAAFSQLSGILRKQVDDWYWVPPLRMQASAPGLVYMSIQYIFYFICNWLPGRGPQPRYTPQLVSRKIRSEAARGTYPAPRSFIDPVIGNYDRSIRQQCLSMFQFQLCTYVSESRYIITHICTNEIDPEVNIIKDLPVDIELNVCLFSFWQGFF